MEEGFLSNKLVSESDKFVTKNEFEKLKNKEEEETKEIGKLNNTIFNLTTSLNTLIKN